MRFRTRVTLLTATAVAVAIVLASLAAWFAARTELRNQVDGLLRNQAPQASIAAVPQPATPFRLPVARLPRQPRSTSSSSSSNGTVRRPPDQTVHLPVTAIERDAALGKGSIRLRDIHVSGSTSG